MSTPKTIIKVSQAPARHWVGNGFHVHSMFSYNQNTAQHSPFLMLDYGAPYDYSPNNAEPRGVGSHPHRGFETVTIAYAGEITHRDSTGGGGTIQAGDVQWMTAGSGLVHDEFHSPTFSQSGGQMHMVQLWVNLPAKHKMTQPKYQAILSSDIPTLSNASGSVRTIAGQYQNAVGPTHTFTPMNVLDLNIHAGHTLSAPQANGWTTLLLVQSGSVSVNGGAPVGAAQLITLSQAGEGVEVHAHSAAQVLLLAGQPIAEPVVGYGPFVMNTEQEIRQAFIDYNSGAFGQIPQTVTPS